ncbi:DUF5990 family protein [Streptomyces sp. NPDC015171]|uniref:DUF5990 family protein n=1 Tax=Streptomyces sp. NPDC015171 TaxID=3364945 RepID=UPI0036F581F7
MSVLRIRIEGAGLPGRTFVTAAARDGGVVTYDNVHVAVQRRNRPGELLDPQPGDAASARWTLPCTTTGVDVTGPYVQGRPDERFVYLSWGSVDPSGAFTMFRRAKIMLGAVPADVLSAAAHGGLLTARLGLTDARGGPLCARVVPPAVTWGAGVLDER